MEQPSPETLGAEIPSFKPVTLEPNRGEISEAQDGLISESSNQNGSVIQS